MNTKSMIAFPTNFAFKREVVRIFIILKKLLNNSMKEIALITGATAGIGKATAELLSKKGFDLIITGRRNEQLLKLREEIEKTTDSAVISLCFDIRNYEETKLAIESLTGKWKHIDILVNNAGLAAGLAHFQEGSLEDWEQMIDTNIKGLLYISKLVIPGMIERGSGQIINIDSIAGKEAYEKGNVYCATKSAVDALTKGMRIDLLKHGIRVSMISPGLVETEFSLVRFKGDREKAKAPYAGITPLRAGDVAECIYFVVSRPPHVCINDLILTPTAQANSVYVFRKE
jgi:3-hydroxy acid dehydrogenase / malonic semialdehyde reductase